MQRKFTIISLLSVIIITCSFFLQKPVSPAEAVRAQYIQQVKQFEKEIVKLRSLLAAGDEKKLQQQFISVRLSYKQAETIIEYYFNFFAVKLNGPPIPFFEEDEPDVGQQEPTGMQVIESMLFPSYNKTSGKELKIVVDRLLSDTRAMLQTNESFAFDDAFIFDALVEELYRITALGITGFDSQTAVNGLPETKASLEGVKKILLIYNKQITTKVGAKNPELQQLLKTAQQYLDQNNRFNSFNRMEFITRYLNPITKIVGEYKQLCGFRDNPSPMFYSTIRKNNTLFASNVFDVYKYLDDNSTSADKVALGRQLFFDTQLSSDGKRSCATCHNPAKAFTDGFTTSLALDGHSALPRNAPTLWNAALQRNLFLDNRSPSLEDQVMQVLNNATEMHGSAQTVAEKIITGQAYSDLYARAYPAATITNAALNICNAIACYERTLVALNAKFDQQMRGQPSMTRQEVNGFNLFMGKAKCGTCHFMPLFSGAKPPRYYYIETEVIGVPEKNTTGKSALDDDKGRGTITGLPLHQFSFKTTTLRNIALTGPYMHNGVFTTLEQVIDFYNKGGGQGLGIAPQNQSLPFDKLQLSSKEKKDILLFLHTLTDTTGKY